MSVPVTMTLSGKQINVSVAASKAPSAAHGEVWICSISKAVPISIGARRKSRTRSHLPQCGAQPPEGRRLERRYRKLDRAAGKYFPRGVDAAVVYVQDGNREKPGPMLGAAITSLR